MWNGPATVSKSVRLTYAGAGAGAGVGLSEGGLAVWAYADEEHRKSSVLKTIKIMGNSMFFVNLMLLPDVTRLSKFLQELKPVSTNRSHFSEYLAQIMVYI